MALIPKKLDTQESETPSESESLSFFNVISDEIKSIAFKDFSEAEVSDHVHFSKDSREAEAGLYKDYKEDRARLDIAELRELPTRLRIPKYSEDTSPPEKPVTKPEAAGSGLTSERLKRVQAKMENILTLLDRE